MQDSIGPAKNMMSETGAIAVRYAAPGNHQNPSPVHYFSFEQPMQRVAMDSTGLPFWKLPMAISTSW